MIPSDAHLRALPKVELHTHVEGAARPGTIAAIARRNGVDLGVDDPEALYEYRNLADFLRVFDLVCRSLQKARDLHEVTYEALAIAAAAGVRRQEMFFSPTFLLRHGVPFGEIWAGIASGIDDARADFGIHGVMILDVDKPSGPGAADELIQLALGCDRDLLIGIGGDAGERDIDLVAFAPAFARARQAGFRTTMHLGEEGPVSDIAVGVRDLYVERIDHGVCLLDDPDLTAEVVARRVPVTACPTSNASIGVVGSVAEHPLIQLLDAGVLVTVNSDNAAMFGIDLADEYGVVRDAFALDLEDLERLSLAGIEACWADEADKHQMRSSFAAEFRRLRAQFAEPVPDKS